MDASTCRTANDLDLCASAGAPTASSGPGRRSRLGLGRVSAELRRFPTRTSVQVHVGAGEIVLMTPLTGQVELTDGAAAEGAKISLASGGASLFGRAGVSTVVGMVGASIVVLHLPRDEFQVLISRRRNQPTRLAAVDLVASTPPALQDVLSVIGGALSSDAPFGEAATSGLCFRLEAALLEAFLGEASWGPVLQTPRAVGRAVAAIRDGSVLDADRLAVVSGVTPRTLREGFAAVFGVSLAAYLQQARLDNARRSLASSYDSRPIPQVAKDSGFSTASAFSRAYVRAFGESPSDTRALAVRGASTAASGRPVPV